MKACPNCYLSFNDGYICPHCGGQLVDYSPEQSSPSSSYQTNTAQQSYYNQPSQSYAAQQAQSMQAAAAQSSYTQPQQAVYQPQAPIIAPPKYKKRTGLVVFLTLLLLAVAAFAGYLVYEEYIERTQPTDMDQQVARSAWTWYSTVGGMLSAVAEEASANESSDAHMLDRGNSSAKSSEGSTGGTSATEANDQLKQEADATVSPGDGENIAAASSAPTSSPTSPEDAASVQNSDIIADETASSGSDAVNTDALNESMQQFGEAIGEMMSASIAIAIVSDTSNLALVDGPMQALKEKFPELVSAWDALKGSITTDSFAKAQTSPAEMSLLAQQFKQTGESFKRTAESEGFDTASWK